MMALAAAATVASAETTNTATQAAPTLTELEQRWQMFQANPVQFMEMTPPKRVQGRAALPLFSPQDIRDLTYMDKKSAARQLCDESGICVADVLEGRAAARQNARDFFDARELNGLRPVMGLKQMESQGLMSGELAETPWSDSYWPIYQGILGARYANRNFMGAANWKAHYEFTSQQHTLKAIADKGSPIMLDSLGPSEKYDLLIGELTNGRTVYESGYLTPSMWEQGRGYWDDKGEVEAWMGICHGWAVAAYMLPRPSKSVETTSADGKNTLKFYPSDIKGLASYIWAQARVPTRFIGGRCNDKDAKRDPQSGRVLDEDCFDTNPANWHQIVVNQIGLAKKSFVMDATYDYEVWNHPVFSYSYRYFNPETGRQVETLEEATVEMANFSKDKFKKFRSPNAKSVVGIEMDVTYVVETQPSHADVDSASYDATSSVTYMYDIELDAQGRMIGGEWYSNKHPDFLWSPVADGRAASQGDARLTGAWDPSQPLPQFWRDVAVATAVRTGMPLAGIVEALVEASNK
jgi:hypothetical protein